jgi:hypothetical protein
MSENRLLLVAGPSGAGKSEFIRQIKDGTLPQGVMAALPHGCSSWPLVEANNMLKDGLSATQLLQGRNSVVAHYDLTFIHRFGISDYAQDPFNAVLTNAGPIVIVSVRPDIQRLTAQYRGRSEMHRRARSRSHQIWADWVRLPLKRAALKAQGLPAVDAGELYATPGFLEICYREWDSFLGRLAASNSHITLINVSPVHDPFGNPAFELREVKQSAHSRAMLSR